MFEKIGNNLEILKLVKISLVYHFLSLWDSKFSQPVLAQDIGVVMPRMCWASSRNTSW